MSLPSKSDISVVLKATFPVAMGYFPLGVAFGLLFSKLGHHWAWAAIMATFVYAGAAQFLAVSLLATNADLFTVFSSTLILNIRHIFYGIGLLDPYAKLGRLKRCFAIFSLTDETFAILTSDRVRLQRTSFILAVSALDYFYWVASCSLGAWAGQVFDHIPEGIEFALIALFSVLLIERVIKDKPKVPLVLAAVAAMTAYLATDAKYFVACSALLGCTLLVVASRFRHVR